MQCNISPVFPIGIADTDCSARCPFSSLVSRHHKQNNIPLPKDAILVILVSCHARLPRLFDNFLALATTQPPPSPHCGEGGREGSLNRVSVPAVSLFLLGDDVRFGQSPATGLSCRRGFSGFPPRIPAPYTLPLYSFRSAPS
jgi:hypothetical protein